VSVSDNGVGITEENLTRIFVHGFTTKKDGHGFGLHSGVLAAREMGGSLTVHSAGTGAGATFTLKLPLNPATVGQMPPPDGNDVSSKPGRAAREPAIAPETVEALRELATDEDDDVLTELIDTFLDNAPRTLTKAGDALSRHSPAGLAQAAHTLMGSCSNFGAKPLQDLSAQLESLARSPDYLDSPDAESRAGELLDAIRGELERVATALGAYRKKL